MTHATLSVPAAIVDETLAFLRSAGARNSEAVVLWLGRRTGEGIVVEEAYVPDQKAAIDFFHIPPEAMSALLSYLRMTGYFIAAQVHSHPREAFHSDADDRWAVVRHRGALSLVVPRFARDTEVGTFLQLIAAFSLSATNVWQEIAPPVLPRAIVIA